MIRSDFFSWQYTRTDPKIVPFRELFSRFGVELKESSVRLMQVPGDSAFWTDAPKSHAFEPVLSHYLRAEIGTRPEDERVLWSLAGLAVERCANDFGREWLSRLCIREPRNIRWLVEAAMWVFFASGHDTTRDLRESLEQIRAARPDVSETLRVMEGDADPVQARAARIAVSVMQGQSVVGSLPPYQAARRMKPYDSVKVVSERFRDQGAPPGTIGNIIELWAPGVFEVEVSGKDGSTIAEFVARADELEPLH